MRRFGVRPDRDLGQNFLIDSNILGVIGRAAELAPQDVVLEIGGGLGVLSEYLAQRARHVHVVEIDERLREALCDATDRAPERHRALGRRHGTRPGRAGSPAGEGRREPALRRGGERAAAHASRSSRACARGWRWCSARSASGWRPAPGGGAYGVPSVLAQLACEVEVLRAIPRTVFLPVPNVDSVLVGMRRRGRRSQRRLTGAARARRRCVRPPAQDARGLARPAQAARPEGHRLAEGQGSSREQVREALAQLGQPADARAERLAPEDFRALARLLEL